MRSNDLKHEKGLARRHRRVRGKISGTPERPRRDDVSHTTICGVSTLGPEFKATGKKGGTVEGAAEIGTIIGKMAQEKGVTKVVFDRGGHLYHGRVKALADAAREAGLVF